MSGERRLAAWLTADGDVQRVGVEGTGTRNGVVESIRDHAQPYATALIRGRVTEVLDGDDAWRVIDRICHTCTGKPYPLRSDRVVLLIEPSRPRRSRSADASWSGTT